MQSASTPNLFLLIPELSWSPGQDPPATTSGPCPATPALHPSQHCITSEKSRGLCPCLLLYFGFSYRSSCFLFHPFIHWDFFWVSAAGHLLVSEGWGCRSHPVLEILGLQPQLHLLRLSLHAIVVTLAGPGRATPISYVFKLSSICSIISPSPTMCPTGHTPSSWTVMLYFPCFSWWGLSSVALFVSKGAAKEEKSIGHVLDTQCLPKICHKATFPWLAFQMADLLPWYSHLKCPVGEKSPSCIMCISVRWTLGLLFQTQGKIVALQPTS